jgi:hypothetical protein
MSISRGYRVELNPPRYPRAARDTYSDTGAAAKPAPEERDRPASRSDEATQDWLAAAQRVAMDVDLDASAHAYGAMLRRRGVPTATNLLCLALMHGPGRMPLRMIAERAEAHGIAKVSEPALLRRLCNAAPWLDYVVDSVLVQRLAEQQGDQPAQAAEAATGRLRLGPPVGSMSPLGPRAQSVQERQAAQSVAARGFIVQFTPWPADLFSDTQIHWLLCVRWNFVSANLRDTLAARNDAEAAEETSLDRCRLNASLLAALISADM